VTATKITAIGKASGMIPVKKSYVGNAQSARVASQFLSTRPIAAKMIEATVEHQYVMAITATKNLRSRLFRILGFDIAMADCSSAIKITSDVRRNKTAGLFRVRLLLNLPNDYLSILRPA